MSVNSVLEVDHLSKLYARSMSASRKRAGRNLLRVMLGMTRVEVGKLEAAEFWALKDVNFGVERGQSLGVIGLNGSGKTTLLRLLSGQLLPDEGEIRSRGSLVPLIDATAGFRMNASGRDNIFLKGALLGRNREEMDNHFEEIVSFSELEDAIDAPISSYSTGMLMRLAFAVNTAVEPDLLLIDETLSVGDFRFRQKCLAKLRELRERSSFLLVSHSMVDIKRFCDRTIVLSKGRVVFEGESSEAVDYYESMRDQEVDEDARIEGVLRPWFENESALADLEHYWCTEDGTPVEEIATGDPLYFHAAFTLTHSPRHLVMGVPVWTDTGHYVTGFSTEVGDERFEVVSGERVVFRLEVPSVAFNPGTYISNFGLTDGPEFITRAPNPPLRVTTNRKAHWGVVSLPHRWRKVGSATGMDERSSDDDVKLENT